MILKYVMAKTPEQALKSFSRPKSLLTFDTEEKCRELLDGVEVNENAPWKIYRVNQDVGGRPTVTHMYTQEVQ